MYKRGKPVSSATQVILLDKNLPGTVQPVSPAQGRMHMDSITHNRFLDGLSLSEQPKGTLLKAKLHPISIFFFFSSKTWIF